MTDDEQEALFLSAGSVDEYNLAKIKFVPDVLYDIGADVGSVTLHANKLFPQTKIVAVEPNPWSFPRLAKNAVDIPQIVPVNVAIGRAPMYTPAREAASPLLWFVTEKDSPVWGDALPIATVPSMTLAELYAVHGGEHYAVKVDCEGGEVGMMEHEPSRKVLLNSSYFAAEIHYWGRTQERMLDGADIINRFMFELLQTHTVYTYGYGVCVHVWAKRREPRDHVEAWLG